MIPKIIHTFWGGDEKIEHRSFIDNWKQALKGRGYKIIVWKPEDFFLECSGFLKYTIKNRFWAHASDFIRFYVLNQYGGFWLDTDVKILKPFDDLLNAHYIISCANYGDESDIFGLDALNTNNFKSCFSCFGFEKNHPFLQGMIEEYRWANFNISEDGCNEMDVSAFAKRFMSKNNLEFDIITDTENHEALLSDLEKITGGNDKITLLPSVMFDYRYTDEPLHPLMYASHKHWGSWVPKYLDAIQKKEG